MDENELYENIYRILFERERSFLEISAEANEIAAESLRLWQRKPRKTE